MAADSFWAHPLEAMVLNNAEAATGCLSSGAACTMKSVQFFAQSGARAFEDSSQPTRQASTCLLCRSAASRSAQDDGSMKSALSQSLAGARIQLIVLQGGSLLPPLKRGAWKASTFSRDFSGASRSRSLGAGDDLPQRRHKRRVATL